MSARAAEVVAGETELDLNLEDYWPRAYRFAVMITGNDAEAKDIAQEALIKAWRQAGSYDPHRGTFDAWLWRIVLNVARDAGRAARRRMALWDRLRDHQPSPVDVESLALDHIDDQALLAAVRRLPKRPRTLIALRFGAHLAYREIGGQMGLSEAATLMATRRALAALRRDLTSLEASR